ncbi:DNA methyltransferase [Chloroflexota bacterium]
MNYKLPMDILSSGDCDSSASELAAEGHTPVYKMHKYFARRPHNVFRHLIETYTKPGEIILDCFCGGGVTLFEGLAAKRKVIAVDLNPLATFVSSSQVTRIDLGKYQTILRDVYQAVNMVSSRYYSTTCRKCGQKAEVRWYELTYIATCRNPLCNNEIVLSDNNKAQKSGKPVNGRYECPQCHREFAAVDVALTGYKPLTVTYKCKCTSGRQTAPVDENDIALFNEFENNFNAIAAKYQVWYPKDRIPENWDRQHEDCLHRKSITRFSDFFTKRSLFFNALLLKYIQGYRDTVPPDLYHILLFTFSAILRYTNNMTFSTGNWMDGRPVAWAKHAYWVPYQFVEVNPLEYIEKRRNAIVSGLRYQAARLSGTKQVDNFYDLLSGGGTHIVWTQSSSNLDIPDESVTAVITDPPYGSNVQYGELSHFWLVWLQRDLQLDQSLFKLGEEILVNRKIKDKDYNSYFEGLRCVFKECHRVLKPNGVLVFTFNNKALKTWLCVIKAAIEAGFQLDPRDIVFQKSIENYRNTAHTRYAGSIHGDFIYTFRKKLRISDFNLPSHRVNKGVTPIQEIGTLLEKYVDENGPASMNELHVCIITHLIPSILFLAETGDVENKKLKNEDMDGLIKKFLVFNESDKKWHKKQLVN